MGRRVSWVRFEGAGLGEIEVWDDRDAASYLEARSRNWRNVFDASTGFIRPRDRAGQWLEPFDPLSPEDFVEANAWQATWFTSHDVMGLANLMGGEEVYANKLNFAFESAKDTNFIADYGDGYVSYGNQPGLQMAHMFNYVGYPWLTQHWVREVKEKTYGAVSTTDGYGHFDEDQGQMGAMSALMAIGLFEVTGGSLSRPVYDITSPIFDKVTIDLNRDYYAGRKFEIATHGQGQYIQRARLDGRVLDNAWFTMTSSPTAARWTCGWASSRTSSGASIGCRRRRRRPSIARRSTRPRSRSRARTAFRALRDGGIQGVV